MSTKWDLISTKEGQKLRFEISKNLQKRSRLLTFERIGGWDSEFLGTPTGKPFRCLSLISHCVSLHFPCCFVFFLCFSCFSFVRASGRPGDQGQLEWIDGCTVHPVVAGRYPGHPDTAENKEKQWKAMKNNKKQRKAKKNNETNNAFICFDEESQGKTLFI